MSAMILVIRRFIIFLLLVLQGFAPLVHAHVHIVDSEDGVHIHGVISATSHEHQLTALDKFSCSNTAIGMHSAIQKKKSLDADLNADTCYAIYTDFVQFTEFIEKTVGFSPPGSDLKSLLLLSDFSPRAPPL